MPNKISLLRDVCLATGVVLHVKPSQEALCILLENDSLSVKRTLTEQLRKQQPQQSKGKKGKGSSGEEALPDAELFKYDNLPFKPHMIGDFFPILKKINHQNKDSTIFASQGRQFLAENDLMAAFDFYNQAVSVMMQVNGPMNMDTATSIQKMSNVQYKLSDYLTAIELLSKSIIIQEKVLGFDHPKVAYSYSNLGLYYHSAKFYRKGFEMMHRSLRILEQASGPHHPDVLHIYMNLGLMYSDAGRYKDSIQSFNSCLKRYLQLYGENHIQVVSCYQAIAHAFYLQEDFRKALEYQEKCHLISKQLMPEGSEFLAQSKMSLDKFMHLSIQQEKAKAQQKGGREIGQNPKQQISELQQEQLAQRQRVQQLKQAMTQQATFNRAFFNTYDPSRQSFMEMVEQKYRAQQYESILKKQHDIEMDKLEDLQAKQEAKQEEGKASKKKKNKK